jgi:hypothetical protein
MYLGALQETVQQKRAAEGLQVGQLDGLELGPRGTQELIDAIMAIEPLLNLFVDPLDRHAAQRARV